MAGSPGPVAKNAGSRRGTTGSAGDANVQQLLRAVVKRRWTALAGLLVVAVPACLYSMALRDEYQATVRLQVGLPLTNPAAADAKEPDPAAFSKDQYELLQSRSVVRQALQDLKVKSPGPFVPPQTPLAVIQGVFRRDAPAPASDPAPPVDAFLANIKLTAVPESRLVDVVVTANGPEAAATLANALARSAIRHELELRFHKSREAARWLEEQLGSQKEKVAASEAALQQYKEKEDALSVEDRQNIVVQKLSDLNAAVTRAKTERITKEELYNRLKALQQQPGATDTFPGILSSGYIQQLKGELAEMLRQRAQLSEQYGELHPEIVRINAAIAAAQRRLEGEIGKVAESVHNEYLAALAQERSLSAALEAQKETALALNRKGIEYSALEREASGNRQIYENLLQQTKRADISADLQVSPIAIVDAAEPPIGPARPARVRNLAASIGGGILAALGLVFLLEALDRRITSPDQIRQVLGLPFLGYVPLTSEVESVEVLQMNEDAPPRFREALRRIRANLLLSSAAEGTRTLVVTSTAPREGKTVLAGNLAVALAQTGQRVILIDADMRRARVHGLFDRPSTPGLSSVLTGAATLAAAIAPTAAPNLWILPAGPLPPNPPELLSSARFKAVLGELGGQYDYVIFDTPPVMAVADAVLIAHHVTGVIYVVGAEMIARDTIAEALGELRSANAPLLGAILNRIDLDREGYYYSRYYNPDYETYYTGAARS